MSDNTIYAKYEGKILGAIDGVFGGTWWGKLSEATQEEIHGALFQVLDVRLNSVNDSDSKSPSKCVICKTNDAVLHVCNECYTEE
jgi:hypothetical protein